MTIRTTGYNGRNRFSGAVLWPLPLDAAMTLRLEARVSSDSEPVRKVDQYNFKFVMQRNDCEVHLGRQDQKRVCSSFVRIGSDPQ
jgi:hypothetical protein